MTNPELCPHCQLYQSLAASHDLEPSEVEHMARYFGNDFEALEAALDDLEAPDDLGELIP